MKPIILLALLFPLIMMAQTETKPPKLRIEQGFLSTRYELGDKTTPSKDVALHLKQYESDAYIKWKDADRAITNELIWTIIGIGGGLVGLFSSEPENQLAGYGVGVVGFSAALVCNINGKSRRQKAIDIYNSKFGY